MPSHIIVPVNDALRRQLVATATHLKQVDAVREGKLCDLDHYRPTVNQLEALVTAVLGATTSTPLTGPYLLAARFRIDTGGQLNRTIMDVVTYLRDTASEVLAVADFHRYKTDHLDPALAFLRQLNGMILDAIVKTAEADLVAVKKLGVVKLLDASNALAKATRVDDEPKAAPRREDVEGTWNPAG